MHAKDVRAVENPITAIFDLADEVEGQAPKFRGLLKYTRIFAYTWLVLGSFLILFITRDFGTAPLAFLLLLLFFGFLLMRSGVTSATAKGLLVAAAIAVGVLLVFTFRAAFVLGAVLVSLFALGMVILDLVRDAQSFFDYYALRYRVIRAVREADPVVYVPQGATPVERLLASLAQRSATFAAMLARPGAVHAPALLTGKSGVAYQFDAFVSWPAGTLAPIGIGPSGGAAYVKAFEKVPTRADVEALRRAVEDVSASLHLPPKRVIALWKSEGRTEVPEDTYAFLTSEVVHAHIRGRTYACSVELVTEMPDGTYDFIPLVVDTPPTPAWSAAAAHRA